ncbi:hypothetical protein [Ramlibacter sp. WS9]|uniref:hypothetical protein n=1 Tax=Ramlibacter sp. WS9 TaxID=1882741 RepID=UPI0011757EFA|nr:hypothetical protein [Ramlibacter sp. WS9]ROZ71517.1 hypothetical protein EEB15_20975 [Ramlibacter sp. WS9]
MITVPVRYRDELVGAFTPAMVGSKSRWKTRVAVSHRSCCRASSLVALTGCGRDNDRSRALAASFDEHLVTAVTADRLLGQLRQLLAAGHR